MQEYETVPQEFRDALETAVPKLINHTAEIAELEPEAPVDLIPHELVGVTVY